MDNYPAKLAPEFEEGGGVATPFEDWWPAVKHAFPHVPEQVAADWLHRHWSHSPFGWLPSQEYSFRLVEWPQDQILKIRTGWSDFVENPAEAIEHGRYLATEHRQNFGYRLADFMVEHGTFPVPPILIDNRDAHPPYSRLPYPPAFLLVEGHRRFNIAAYLASNGRLIDSVPFWLMERVS